MLTLYKYEGKTEEEAINECLTNLNIDLDNLFINKYESEAGKLFKSKKIVIEVLKKDDIVEYVKNYITEFGKKFNITINSEVKLDDNIINVVLVSSNNGILIGKEGRTLEAIQTLLRQSINNVTDKNFKIHIYASNYKSKKQKNLEYEIKKIAKDVLNTKVEVKLDPMNSYDRRCVHNVVAKFEKLQSKSFGENPDRYVVISYKED